MAALNVAAPLPRDALRQKVFVSYSRTDIKFADEVVSGLEYDGGFEVFLDRHSIHEGEAWRERLAGLIAAADAVVFLLSKASAGSELCRWEVDQAKGLSKRIVPALIEAVDGAAAPPALAALQYVRFDTGSFMGGLAGLREALRADLGWVREHTRLLTRAQEWETAGRIPNRLLSGPDIAAAKAWLDHRPQDAPAPLELHRDFIAASEQAETARLGEDRKRAVQLKSALGRSRIMLGAAIVAGITAAGAGVWAFTVGAGAESAAQERDDFIATQEKTIAKLTAQLAAIGDGALSAGAQVEIPSLSVGADVPKPPPVSAATPSPSTAGPPPTSPTKVPPSTSVAKAAPSEAMLKQVAQLEVDAGALRDQITGLAGPRTFVPAAPVRGDGTLEAYADQMEKYIDALRQQRQALLVQSPVQQKAPERYNPVLIPKK